MVRRIIVYSVLELRGVRTDKAWVIRLNKTINPTNGAVALWLWPVTVDLLFFVTNTEDTLRKKDEIEHNLTTTITANITKFLGI